MGEPSSATQIEIASIEGWTKEEKFYLLQGLKTFGSHDIERIQEYISSKSPQQVIMAINHYKKIAAQHPVFATTIKKVKKQYKPRVPLSSWAKLLTDHMSFEKLKTETATAVRMIAELENIPVPACTDHIDFRKIYHTLANAMEGKHLVTDKFVISVLNKCIVETALSSKAFIKTSSYKSFINGIDLKDREALTFPRPTEQQELTILRHLAAQKSYNPLKVSEDYLKPAWDAKYDNEPPKQYTGPK